MLSAQRGFHTSLLWGSLGFFIHDALICPLLFINRLQWQVVASCGKLWQVAMLPRVAGAWPAVAPHRPRLAACADWTCLNARAHMEYVLLRTHLIHSKLQGYTV